RDAVSLYVGLDLLLRREGSVVGDDRDDIQSLRVVLAVERLQLRLLAIAPAALRADRVDQQHATAILGEREPMLAGRIGKRDAPRGAGFGGVGERGEKSDGEGECADVHGVSPSGGSRRASSRRWLWGGTGRACRGRSRP